MSFMAYRSYLPRIPEQLVPIFQLIVIKYVHIKIKIVDKNLTKNLETIIRYCKLAACNVDKILLMYCSN